MMLWDVLIGIVLWLLYIMDLVKCDGVVLYYGKWFWLLGVILKEV